MDPIYRADQVGSLLRPAELLEARRNPDISHGELTGIEDRHILDVLDRQKRAGFKIFTDGELRRTGFMGDFYESVEGLDREYDLDRTWKGAPAGVGVAKGIGAPGGAVVARLRQTKRLTKHEVDFLKRHAPGDIKMTLPTANQFPAIAYKKGVSDRAYATYSEFLWDIVPIMKAEIHALVDEGVKYIQIDAPRYSYYIDPKWRHYVEDEMGVDPETALDEAIRVDNACLEGVKRDGVTLAMHLCRGNNRSQWYAEGGYDPIAEKLFTQLNVDRFLLEYESERAGTFDARLLLAPDARQMNGLEPADQLSRSLRTIDGILREARKDEIVERLWNRELCPQRWRVGLRVSVVQKQPHRRIAGEDKLPRQQPVGDASGRVNVRSVVHGRTQRLLRCDEPRRALHGVLDSQRRPRVLSHR